MRDGAKFRLGDLCSITKGETPIKQAVPGRYPLVVTASERATHETFQFDCRAVIVPLVSSTGHGHASIKRIHYQEGKFALGSILCAVVPKDEKRLNPQFLHVYFSYFKDQLIVPLMKGSANVSLAVSTLANLKIIVPPMDVQMRVVSLSQNDVLMKPLENEIAHQEAMLGKLKQAILQEAIQGKLTADWRTANPDTEPASELLKRIEKKRQEWIRQEKALDNKEAKTLERKLNKLNRSPINPPQEALPQKWKWATLLQSNLLIVDCHNKTAPYATSGIPIIRTTNVRNGQLDLDNTKFITEETYRRWSARCIPLPGDLIFTREAPVGEVGQIPEKATVCLGQRTMLIRPIPEFVRPDYLLFVIQSPGFISRAAAAKHGSMVGHLRVSSVENTMIPLPPLAEQAAIVERVEALMESCRALETEIEHSRTHAAHLLQAVLKEAFSPAS